MMSLHDGSVESRAKGSRSDSRAAARAPRLACRRRCASRSKPAQTRLNRESSHATAKRRQAVFVHGAKLPQQGQSLRDSLRTRRLQPGKPQHVRLAPAQQLQCCPRQVDAANLRIGLCRPQPMVRLAPQPDTDAWLRASRTTAALIGRGLRDVRELQAIQAHVGIIDQLPRQAGIDHASDAFHGHAGFRHIGGQHDSPLCLRQQRSILLIGRQITVQRQHEHDCAVPPTPRAHGPYDESPASRGERPGYRQASRQEARHCLRHCCRPRPAIRPRLIANLDRMQPAFAGDDRTIVQIAGSLLDGQCGGHDDDAQLRPHGLLHEPHQAQGEVVLQASLVKLIENDRTNRLQKRFFLQSSEQNTGRYGQNARRWSALAIKAHLIADLFAQPATALMCDPLRRGPCRQSPRLQEHNLLTARQKHVEQGWRHARRLPCPRRCAEHRTRASPQRSDQLRKHGINRQGRTAHPSTLCDLLRTMADIIVTFHDRDGP